MKNIFFLIIIFLSLSCKKECELPEETIGSGLIVSNGSIIDTTLFLGIESKDYVIRTDSQNVFNLKVSFDNNLTKDSIDFSKYTVLGKYASGQCRVVFERDVSKNKEQKKYIYTIRVKECGNCESITGYINWVLIPKIEEDFSVSFKVE